MYITKKHLSRRTLLRGAGAGLALPFLDAMVPAQTALAKTAAAAKPRLAFVYFPHGAIMDRWTPTAAGRDFEMTPILTPLAKYREKMTIVSGLHNKAGESPSPHAITSGTWLSCVAPRISHSPFGGVTVDQIAARQVGQDTTFPSLEVSTEPGSTGGNGCDRNYGCSYGSTISFRTPSQPLPMENNPRKLFYRLFGVGDTAEERAIAANQYASLLDLVSDEAKTLQLSLGAQDRAMVSDYLSSVREIEQQVKKAEEQDLSKLKLPNVPTGVLPDFDARLNLMFDILALAYQGNLTRVVNMMIANEGSGQTYNHVGVPDAFHPLSHHQNSAAKIDRLTKIQTYHSTVFAKFLDKLAATSDGENSVFDNAIILYGSNMSNSNKHDHYPLPSAVFGGGCGKLKGGQHIKAENHTPLANLHLTLLDRAGVRADSFGDSTGRFSEL
ncbi:MAG: DUF1552 domain-containing protein [Hyphomonadaceae bacterium]|nr:DUF1552 domain-containing protein [Hyphomonadaceae bacterium]